MNSLLKFYLPKTIIEILKFYSYAVAAAIALQFLPLDNGSKNSFSIIIIFIIFPLVSYFNSIMYLPASLVWILLTPNKKLHIIFAHGVLNIFKMALLILLAFLFLYFSDKAMILKFFSGSSSLKVYTRVSVNDLISWFSIIVFLVVFLFGILPSYIQTIQQKQNYHVKHTQREKIKIYLLILGIVLGAVALISAQPFTEAYLPFFIQYSIVFYGVAALAIYSTLTSVRFYFSHIKLGVFLLVFAILLSCFLNFYGSGDITSDKLHIKDKMKSLNSLGIYSHGLEKNLEDEFIASKPGLAQLTRYELLDFFTDEKYTMTERKDMAKRVSDNWETLCTQRYDFTCRLAYYMAPVGKVQDLLLNQVRKACPNDLGSCYIVYDHKELPVQETLAAKDILIERCKDNKNESDKNACYYFNKASNKKKK